MSVVIIGMPMPLKGCDHCFMREGNLCSRLNESVVKYAMTDDTHPYCPLREVELVDGKWEEVDNGCACHQRATCRVVEPSISDTAKNGFIEGFMKRNTVEPKLH